MKLPEELVAKAAVKAPRSAQDYSFPGEAVARVVLQAALDSGHLLLVPPGEVGLSLTKDETHSLLSLLAIYHDRSEIPGALGLSDEDISVRDKLSALTPDEQER